MENSWQQSLRPDWSRQSCWRKDGPLFFSLAFSSWNKTFFGHTCPSSTPGLDKTSLLTSLVWILNFTLVLYSDQRGGGDKRDVEEAGAELVPVTECWGPAELDRWLFLCVSDGAASAREATSRLNQSYWPPHGKKTQPGLEAFERCVHLQEKSWDICFSLMLLYNLYFHPEQPLGTLLR